MRELGVALAGGLALALAMLWPLPIHLARDVPHDLGDPQLEAWQIAWDAHALLHQPLHFWQANTFWPLPDSLAFSDALIGYVPIGLLGSGFEAAIWHYNVAILTAFAVAFAGAYALARELDVPWPAAIVAGTAFAWSPWRWEQIGHLHIVSSGPIALSLALLVRGYRRDRPAAVVGGWCVVAWQILIGVSLALYLLYLLAVLAFVAAVASARAGRPRVRRRLVRASGLGLIPVILSLLIVVPPYLRVRAHYPESRRTPDQIALFSPPPEAFLAAPADNLVWGDATAPARAHLHVVPEMVLFPGAVTLVLALTGLAASTFSRRMRIGLAAAAALCAVFSMGFEPLGGHLTYRLLYDYAPGWDGPRTPGRLHTLTTLALALLAAAGTTAMLRRWSAARPRLAVGGCVVVAGLIALEGCAFQVGRAGSGLVAGPAHPSAPKPPAGLAGARAPLLHLPPDPAYSYMLWSTDGFPAIVNGVSGFQPFALAALVGQVQAFPDASSIRALRDAGVRTVVLHKTAAAATPWSASSAKPLRGLAVRKRQVGDLVLFEIGR
jgi:hypothetical protein